MTQRPTQLDPGSPADPAAFGKYFLLGPIARGGMAEVYRARPRSENVANGLLAIKVMRPQLAREARFIEMFNREGELAMMLQHENIVRTHDVGKIDGRHYIAMEYIGGRDLNQVLRRCQESNTRIPMPHAVYIASRIAEGLAFAHALKNDSGKPLNLVNRDVSPSNVRISYDGEVKLLDFGIAQALMRFTSEIGVLKGKFSYMSPEQIRGMPLDSRTDVFSAGIILHEMLTTEKLFRGDSEFALMEKVRKADIPPPSAFNKRVNERLDAIVMRALARDVGRRYQSAQAFADDLKPLVESYGFAPKELQQFVRKLFRAEYTEDRANTTAALSSSPQDAAEPVPIPSFEVEPPQSNTAAVASQGAQSQNTPSPNTASVTPKKKRGLWARLTGRD